ncbi:hypothetical protein [Pollutibacter soli]|uniref:hypothetical protein n=1 Tax=Pollutibacter soli TaxID=3034157 RepID=UPI00301325E3
MSKFSNCGYLIRWLGKFAKVVFPPGLLSGIDATGDFRLFVNATPPLREGLKRKARSVPEPETNIYTLKLPGDGTRGLAAESPTPPAPKNFPVFTTDSWRRRGHAKKVRGKKLRSKRQKKILL